MTKISLWLDYIDKIARILSLVAIPVVIAFFGWVIQNRLSERNVGQEYVKMAVSILEKPKSSEVPAGLRDWAVDLLNQNSPTKFSSETIRQLKTGQINLAGLINNLASTSNSGGGIAVSPDGMTVATGQDDGQVAIWELNSGRLLRKLRAHRKAVTAVVYSPDARKLFSGSLDNAVKAWDLATGEKLWTYESSSQVVGLGTSFDGKSLVVRSADRKLQTLDTTSGHLQSEIQFKFEPARP